MLFLQLYNFISQLVYFSKPSPSSPPRAQQIALLCRNVLAASCKNIWGSSSTVINFGRFMELCKRYKKSAFGSRRLLVFIFLLFSYERAGWACCHGFNDSDTWSFFLSSNGRGGGVTSHPQRRRLVCCKNYMCLGERDWFGSSSVYPSA